MSIFPIGQAVRFQMFSGSDCKDAVSPNGVNKPLVVFVAAFVAAGTLFPLKSASVRICRVAIPLGVDDFLNSIVVGE